MHFGNNNSNIHIIRIMHFKKYLKTIPFTLLYMQLYHINDNYCYMLYIYNNIFIKNIASF